MARQSPARVGALLLILLFTGASGQGSGHRRMSATERFLTMLPVHRQKDMCFKHVGEKEMDAADSKLGTCGKDNETEIITCTPYCPGALSSMEIYPVYLRSCSNVDRVVLTLTPIHDGETSGSETVTTLDMFDSDWSRGKCATFLSANLIMGMNSQNCNNRMYRFNINQYNADNDAVACDGAEYRFFSRTYAD